jgi:hypothetical protein
MNLQVTIVLKVSDDGSYWPEVKSLEIVQRLLDNIVATAPCILTALHRSGETNRAVSAQTSIPYKILKLISFASANW